VKQTVLVTGAHGFVASALIARLSRDDVAVRCSVREGSAEVPSGVQVIANGAIDGSTDWRAALNGATAVVHCAARVHQLHEPTADALSGYRRVNRDGTLALARQAADAGTRRLIFLSSIKVNGESTPPGRPFRGDDRPAPLDPYAVSKWEAEQELRLLAASTGLEVVVIRPPLVYGPGVKANFRAMMKSLRWGIPLPFGAVHNRRSLVCVSNLIDLVLVCLHHPDASGRTFLVSDGQDLSTTELLQRTTRALGRNSRLIPVSERLLRQAFALFGREGLAHRLLDSLEVDIDDTCRILGWQPPLGVDQALVDTVQHYLRSEGRSVGASG